MKTVDSKAQRDKRVIEAVVRRFGPLSRSQIHELTDLQPSDISRRVRELLGEGKLLEDGHGQNPTGRKQVLLRYNNEHEWVLGVGFDDENVLCAVMNLFPQVRSEVRESTCLEDGAEGLVNQLVQCARTVLDKAGVASTSLAGIGVAGSGLVNSRRGVFLMSSTLEVLKEFPLRQVFEEEFGSPTLLENFTRAKAAAERRVGAGKMAEDMIFIEYGRTGIGAGIIINGRLIHGTGFAAGEFGHTHVMDAGPACRCGSFGCLETVAGAAALEVRIRRAIAEGGGSQALELAGGDPDKITGWTALRAACMGDKTCAVLVEQAGNYLGLGIANLVNLFNPAVLVLDQRLELAGQGFLEQISRIVRMQALHYATRDLEIRFGRLGPEAVVLGVGSIVLERRFEIPTLKLPRFMVEAM